MKKVHIVLFGATDIGYLIVSRLYKGHDITLIDEHEKLPERFSGFDIAYMSGSGADIELLESLELTKENIFIACSLIDETNIVSCWTIKKIQEVVTVCFVSKAEIYKNLVSEGQHRYQTQFDIDTVIWPERLLTQDIFRTIMVPEAVDVEYFSNRKVKLLEYRIKEESSLAGSRIMDYDFPQNVLIVGITREDTLFIPKGTSVVEAGDKVMLMGYAPDLDLLIAKLFSYRRKIRTAMIIGGGSVGFYLASKLEATKVRVKLIEHDKQRCQMLADQLQKSLILHGDGTDIEMLEHESAGEADIVVCVTNNDEKNLLCSLLVKQLGGKRIVTRANNTRNMKLFDKVGIDIVVSANESAMKEIVNLLQSPEVDILATVGGGMAEVLRLTVPETFPETAVMDLQLPDNTLIAVIRRGKSILIPEGKTTMRPGDMLKIFAISENSDSIRAVFAS